MHLATKNRKKRADTISIRMSVEDWLDVPDNPRQRPTEEHAKKALRKHLSKLQSSHAIVHAATCDGEILCKIDGHTRAYVWKNGLLEQPDELLCVCIEVESLEEAADIYTHFDSPVAVETVTDRVGGALRESGIDMSSPLLRHRKFMTAIHIAIGSRPRTSQGGNLEYGLIAQWKQELEILDSWNLPQIHSALCGLALALIRAEYTDSARRFFQGYAAKAGVKNEQGCDGVMALELHMKDRKARRLMTGHANLVDIFGRGLSCFYAFHEGRFVTGGVRCTKRDALDDRIERRMAGVAK